MPTGAKMYDNQFNRGAVAQVTPDEIDRYEQYIVLHPGTSHTAIGTAPVGTSTTSQTFVMTNLRPDYPRNLLVDVSGSNDLGGSATINGFDQFGNKITEVIGFGTSVSPGTQKAGTRIFGQVVSGTWTFAVGSAGSGTPALGYAGGTAAGLAFLFGLPTKIQKRSDVKTLTWDNNTTTTALLGGSIGGTAANLTLVNLAQHAFTGTSVLALTHAYIVTVKSSWDNSGGVNGRMANLSGTPQCAKVTKLERVW